MSAFDGFSDTSTTMPLSDRIRQRFNNTLPTRGATMRSMRERSSRTARRRAQPGAFRSSPCHARRCVDIDARNTYCEGGSSFIIQTSPLKSPSTRMI